MKFNILYGEDMSRKDLDKVFDLDIKVYGPIGERAGEDFVGVIDNLVIRFEHNKRTFVCITDEQNNMAGYINFVPVVDKVWNDIINGPEKTNKGNEVIWDDNLGPNEIHAEYIKNTEDETKEDKIVKHNNLFIISVVIDEKYRGREAVTALTQGFADYLNTLEKEGYGINAISGIAITSDGEKFMRDRLFGIKRFIAQHKFRDTPDRVEEEKNDSIEIVYLTEGKYLNYFLKHPDKLYRKTTKDDVYLFLPYEDSPSNHKLDTLLQIKDKETYEKAPLEIKPLLKNLDYCIKYEYKSKIADELKRIYLGSFRFLHSSDDYPEGEEDKNRQPFIRGEEIVYVSLLAHHTTNMYVVMLCIPNCRYSPSQIEDQLFQGFLKIRPESNNEWKDLDEKGFPKYLDLNDYLSEYYGLYQCGDGKSLLCSSGIPEDTIAVNHPENLPTINGRKISQEFINILTCETYQSFIQDFYVRNKTLYDMAAKNRCVYDYYETYMSERMVAFVLNDFSEDLSDRMELAATYIFIVELVLFQNTALNKLNKNVSTALAYEGDVSYEYIDGLYRDYAKTIKFWNSNNFKYYGTQLEAEQIKDAFDNEDLRNQYSEQQEFLEHMVEVKNARTQERNGMKINILGTIISVIGTQEFAVRLLRRLYEKLIISDTTIAIEEATNTFDVTIIGGVTLFVIILSLLFRKKQQSGLMFRKPGNNKIMERQQRKGFTFKKLITVFILFVMSFVFSYLRPLHMSEGGDVTFLSTIILYLVAYFFGGRVGIVTALIYSLCKIGLDTKVDLLDSNHFIAELYDYIIGYAVIGIGGFFSRIKRKQDRKLDGFWIGYMISVSLRFLESVINCSYFYGETIWYSIRYCMGYIGIEAVFTILILLIPKVREAIEYAKIEANA